MTEAVALRIRPAITIPKIENEPRLVPPNTQKALYFFVQAIREPEPSKGLRTDLTGAALIKNCSPILADLFLKEDRRKAARFLTEATCLFKDLLAAASSIDTLTERLPDPGQLWRQYQEYKLGKMPKGAVVFWEMLEMVHLQSSQIFSGIVGEAKAYYLLKKAGLNFRPSTEEEDTDKKTDFFTEYEFPDGITREIPIQVKCYQQRQKNFSIQIVSNRYNQEKPLAIFEFGIPPLFQKGQLDTEALQEVFDPNDYQEFQRKLSVTFDKLSF